MNVMDQARFIDAFSANVIGRSFSDKSFRFNPAPIPRPPSRLMGIKRMLQAGFRSKLPIHNSKVVTDSIIKTVSQELQAVLLWARFKLGPSTNILELDEYAINFFKLIDGKGSPKTIAQNTYKACGQLGLTDMEAIYVCLYIATLVWPQSEDVGSTIGEVMREIHFSPEHQQASIGILSYFSVILKERLPRSNATVTIRQEVDRVVLLITHSDGTSEEISQLLDDYGLVVVGEKPASHVLSNESQIMALEHKLQMAGLELKMSERMHAMEIRRIDQQVADRNLTIEYLKAELSAQLRDKAKITIGVLDEFSKISDIRLNARTEALVEDLVNSVLDRNSNALQTSAHAISVTDPSLVEKIGGFMLSSSIGGILGNTAHAWFVLQWPVITTAIAAMR